MAKVFEFRRHSIKDGDAKRSTIGHKGFRLAALVGEQHLRDRKFTHYFVSALWRTQQTLVGFGYGACDFSMRLAPSVPPIYLVTDSLHALWRACHAAERNGQDMVRAAFTHDKALVDEVAPVYTELFRTWAASMPDDTNALVVGHSPHLEFLVYGLTGEIIPGLKECEGFRIHVAGEACLIERHAPDLDVATLRTAFDFDQEGPPSRM